VWLPIEFDGERPIVGWRDEWDLSAFTREPSAAAAAVRA